MKTNILVGAAALFVLVLMMAPAVATTDRVTALGKVTDWNGNPVQGADVTLIDDSFRTLGTTTTDAKGDFRFIEVNLSDSSFVKARVSYVHAGQTYTTSLENVRWNDASGGVLNIDPMDTRLYNYPPGDQGYVWGVVLDSLTNGKVMDSTVYLKGNTRMYSTDTSVARMGSFQLQVPGRLRDLRSPRPGPRSAGLEPYDDPRLSLERTPPVGPHRPDRRPEGFWQARASHPSCRRTGPRPGDDHCRMGIFRTQAITVCISTFYIRHSPSASSVAWPDNDRDDRRELFNGRGTENRLDGGRNGLPPPYPAYEKI